MAEPAASDLGEEAAVLVAVRVRPFTPRELAVNSKRCIEMEGKNTMVYEEDCEDTDTEPRVFAFDYSLWSHFDMLKEPAGENPEHPHRLNVSQQVAYQIVGKKLLGYFWEGYDVCLFAYGQSGAGKSFSMTGTGPKCPQALKGMIPLICADTFVECAKQAKENDLVSFNCFASMLEIYIGKIYDLLIPAEEYDIKTRDELFMQMDDVSGLSILPVNTEDDVTDLLVRGFSNQTKAPTGLNVDSSRGHTIFTLQMQKKIQNLKAKKKSDKFQTLDIKMRLVDLAGSERTEKVLEITKEQLETLLEQKFGKKVAVDDKVFAAYKAERTQEGRSINNSLTTLGNCVKQVAIISQMEDEKARKKKMDQIAWRASSLTRLLKTALNGKCKTIMIAAISPSLNEHPETISTLRYANQIKQIKSSAVKKEAAVSDEEKLAKRIKELEDMLAKALAGGVPSIGGGGGGGDEGDDDEEGGGRSLVTSAEVSNQLKELKEQAANAQAREAAMAERFAKIADEARERDQIKSQGPHLLLMMDNNMTSGLYPTALPEGQEVIAGPAGDAVQLKLRGTGVKPIHAVLTNKGGKVTLVPQPKASTMCNGVVLKDKKVLQNNDRLRFAQDNYFRFVDPVVNETFTTEEKNANELKYSFEYMKEEAMQALIEGFKLDEESDAVRVNAMAKELKEREIAFNKQQKELSNAHQQELLEHERQMKSLEEKMLRDKAKAEEELESASEARRNAILAETREREKQLKLKLLAEKKALQQKMLEQQEALKKRLEDEEKARENLKKKEEAERKERESQKAKLHYDLVDAITPVQQANMYAFELKAPVKFEIKITRQMVGGILVNAVTIQLTRNEEEGEKGIKGKFDALVKPPDTEQWTMEEFRQKFGLIVQEFHDLEPKIRKQLPIELKPGSNFLPNLNAPQVIGHAKVMLNFLYFCMPIQDSFQIMSYTGESCGQVDVEIIPQWANDDQAESAEESESINDVANLKYLDLRFKIKRCTTLPARLASDVRCQFSLPDWISNILLPENYKTLMKEGKDDFFTEDKLEENLARGGTYNTDWLPTGLLNINPDIDYDRTIRITSLSKKVKEFFRDSELIIAVMGCKPDPEAKMRIIQAEVEAATKASNEAASKAQKGDEEEGIQLDADAGGENKRDDKLASKEANKARASAPGKGNVLGGAKTVDSYLLEEALDDIKVKQREIDSLKKIIVEIGKTKEVGEEIKVDLENSREKYSEAMNKLEETKEMIAKLQAALDISTRREAQMAQEKEAVERDALERIRQEKMKSEERLKKADEKEQKALEKMKKAQEKERAAKDKVKAAERTALVVLQQNREAIEVIAQKEDEADNLRDLAFGKKTEGKDSKACILQ